MSIIVQTADVVDHGNYLYQGRRYELGDLPEASSALKDLEVAVSAKSYSRLRLKLVLNEIGRFGIAWENADVDCAPFVRRGAISVTAEVGETGETGEPLFHAVIKMQPFPPSEAGIVLGTQQSSSIYGGEGRFRVAFDFTECTSVSTLIDTTKTATASGEAFTGLSPVCTLSEANY